MGIVVILLGVLIPRASGHKSVTGEWSNLNGPDVSHADAPACDFNCGGGDAGCGCGDGDAGCADCCGSDGG